MGASGTYPSPPPPPPPPEGETLLAAAWVFFLVALLLFCCCACYGVYHFSYNRKTKNGNMDARERMAYWCCCFLTCWRTGRSEITGTRRSAMSWWRCRRATSARFRQ